MTKNVKILDDQGVLHATTYINMVDQKINSVDYPIVAITPRSTLTHTGRTY